MAELLAYNTYIASDMEFRKIPGLEETGSRKRPDLFVYSYSTVEPHETHPPFRSLDIFEFKRPMRDDYSDTTNPIEQLFDYLEVIRNRKAKTKDKRVLSVLEKGMIYCHAICDITPNLIPLLKRLEFEQVGNENHYVKYHKGYDALIEVKDIELLIDESKKRNQILFDKLGL